MFLVARLFLAAQSYSRECTNGGRRKGPNCTADRLSHGVLASAQPGLYRRNLARSPLSPVLGRCRREENAESLSRGSEFNLTLLSSPRSTNKGRKTKTLQCRRPLGSYRQHALMMLLHGDRKRLSEPCRRLPAARALCFSSSCEALTSSWHRLLHHRSVIPRLYTAPVALSRQARHRVYECVPGLLDLVSRWCTWSGGDLQRITNVRTEEHAESDSRSALSASYTTSSTIDCRERDSAQVGRLGTFGSVLDFEDNDLVRYSQDYGIEMTGQGNSETTVTKHCV